MTGPFVKDFHQFFPVFSNVVLPVLAAMIFFAMAKYVRRIGPLRTLIAGEMTYRGAYLGFLFMGIYLATRPVQILFPHPWPLIINNLREFCMIGVFGPAVFLAMVSLVFGHENIPRRVVGGMAGFGIVLATVFVVVNSFAIGGAAPLFHVGRLTAYDGLWFQNPNLDRRALMNLLAAIRFLNPILLLSVAGGLMLWHAANYPVEKKMLYDNMPTKLYFLGAACFAFSLSMLVAGYLSLFGGVPNQWWIFYVGALLSGLLETLSLSLPMKKHVQVSEHQ